MTTSIHCSRKLEKLIKKVIQKENNPSNGHLDNWNATVFYVERKKCFLFTHAQTRYNVLIADIKAKDYPKLSILFKESFYSQLIFDGVVMDFEFLCSLLGNISFHSTNNNKAVISFQNQRLYDFEYWKYQYGNIENMPLRLLTERMNRCLTIIDNTKRNNYTEPLHEIKRLLKQL